MLKKIFQPVHAILSGNPELDPLENNRKISKYTG
jgi:hypothetical protein